MLYLLAKDWMWFAPALAVGLAVGWATTTRQAGARFSGAWVIAAAIVLIGVGLAAASVQVLPGRNGLLLETAVMMLAAYFVGCPAGGGAKLLFGTAQPAARAPKKPPPIVVKGASRAASTAGAPRPAPDTAAPSSRIRDADRVAPERKAVAAPSATARGGERAFPGADKKVSGAAPDALSGPRRGRPDDLTRIKGIGPKTKEKLHSLGVWHFDQIAAWTPENVKYMSNALGVPGRIDRGKWVAQAKDLADKEATKENGAPADAG